MKYKDVDVKQARRCCKEHHRKDKYGNLFSCCEVCPLRRTRIDKEGKKRVLFCWYVIRNMYLDMEHELKEIEEMDIQYGNEWEEYIRRLETEE